MTSITPKSPNSIYDNSPKDLLSPSAKPVDSLKEIIITTLVPADRLAEKNLSILITTIKVIFFPLTLFAFLIVRSFSSIASSNGLGTEQAKLINDSKRAKLISMGGEEIKFGIKGQPVLEGMFFEADPKNPQAKTILLCTGSHQSYENYAPAMVEALKSMGHNIMVFNYEGFGNSEGTRSEEGVYRSVEAAYQYLKQEKKCADDSIVAWGYSLGSGAVCDLASKHAVDIVIDRGFSSMSEVAYQSAPAGLKTVAKVIFIVGAHFDNLSKLSDNEGNIFIAQGKWDATMTKSNHGVYLQHAVSNNKNAFFQEVDSGHYHNDDVWFAKDPDRGEIEKFLNRCLS